MLKFSAVFASSKIVVVSISDIFQHTVNHEQVIKQLENEFKDRAIELQLMERDLQEKMQNLQRESNIMSADERSILEKSVIAQREDLSNKAKAFQEDNHYRQTEERDKILNIIHDAVKKIAVKEGYDLVLDANAIAYANNIKDITNDVLKWVK
ncbi:OmpH family outer membrane protein [Blochmannia endosymbiont of Colobopsis nipponica]|nr:OmpH family outer membrane protein [Blochmannia endosymbiont of Colobopsis nipponica]QOI11306.1 OmpH family outer membrane protein [Blochmannia endosymbiont of Colobopsis nipponica]